MDIIILIALTWVRLTLPTRPYYDEISEEKKKQAGRGGAVIVVQSRH